MATKTPGIYFGEIDNTQYTNPRTVSGTTVCVVGFASKGPINVPVLINSYNSFISIFGEGIDGHYSGIAVQRILSAGGGVLFVRVADASATSSNVIIKNGSLGSNGKTFLDRGTDILNGTAGYENKSIYSLSVGDKADGTKQLFVRSPSIGKLTQASILEQLQKGLEETPSSYEALHRGIVKGGVYSFEVSVGGSVVGNTYSPIEVDNQGFYIELHNDETAEGLAEIMKKALGNGPNALFDIELSKAKGAPEATWFDVTSSLNLPNGNYGFTLKKGDLSTPISLNGITTGMTMTDLVSKIDKETQKYGVRCILYAGESSTKAPRIIFFNKVGSPEAITISSLNKSVSLNELFFKNPDSLSELNGFADPLEEDKMFYVNSFKTRNADGKTRTTVNVEYNKDTDSVSFVSTDVSRDDVKIVKAPYGNFVFETKSEEGSHFIREAGDIIEIKKQDALDTVAIKRDADTRKIYFELLDSVDVPTLEFPTESQVATGNFKNLLIIEKDPLKPSSKGYTELPGTKKVEDKEKDMICITSKELGSKTNNISVEFRTMVSPIDENVSQHDVYIYVDGELRETYEDVSYVYKDAEETKKNFITLINEPVDNGGSKYITVAIKKNEVSNREITVEDGIYNVGSANGDRNIKRTTSTDVIDWEKYDYSIGTDGITEDSSIFLKALDKEESPISDEQLYNFHVIIHPDNISQEVQDAAIALCEERGDTITIVDTPVGLSKKAAIDWHNGKGSGRSNAIDSNYAATYWPWCKVYDGATKQQKWVMPSVVMAAKYVNVDRNAGSWYAPAGEENGVLGIMDIEQYPNKRDRKDLYLDFNRINPIIKVDSDMFIAFGEKTLQRKNSALTKIHTRRMLIEIKKQIRGSLRKYVFQPNKTENLSKINSEVTTILEKFKVGGGLNSYKVKCDETNNSSASRQQDIINIAVAVVPNGTIEEINVTFNINKTEESVTAK